MRRTWGITGKRTRKFLGKRAEWIYKPSGAAVVLFKEKRKRKHEPLTLVENEPPSNSMYSKNSVFRNRAFLGSKFFLWCLPLSLPIPPAAPRSLCFVMPLFYCRFFLKQNACVLLLPPLAKVPRVPVRLRRVGRGDEATVWPYLPHRWITVSEQFFKGMFGRAYRCSFGQAYRTYRTYQIVGYRLYRVRTEPYRSARWGIEAVPNLTEDSGRVVTDQLCRSPAGAESWWRRVEIALETLGALVPCRRRYGRCS